jgi:hypothetical protein
VFQVDHRNFHNWAWEKQTDCKQDNIKGDKMINRLWASFFALIPAVVLNVGGAYATETVRVSYKLFPSGSEISFMRGYTIVGTTLTVDQDAPEKLPVNGNANATYIFLFWNINGKENTNNSVSYSPAQNSNTAMTAWYLEEGGGVCAHPPCPPPAVAVTWAFSLDKNEPLAGITPIASVRPNTGNVWASPSTTVPTTVAETITARTTINISSPPESEAFQYWQALGGTNKNTNTSFTAPKESSSQNIAFYNTEPTRACIPLAGGDSKCPAPRPGAADPVTWCERLCACVTQSECAP